MSRSSEVLTAQVPAGRPQMTPKLARLLLQVALEHQEREARPVAA